MLNERQKSKIILLFLIIAVAFTIIFTIFLTFFNTGTVKLNLKAPYNIIVDGTENLQCKQNPCKLKMQTGNHDITINKQGYKSIEISINAQLFKTEERTIKLEFIPTIKELGEETDLQNFQESETKKEEAYIKIDKNTKKQYLYYKDPKETLATTFTRIIQKYKIYPSITENQKIALIEDKNNISSVYIIDLAQKSRNKVLELSNIQNAKWLKNGIILIENLDAKSLTKQITILNTENNEAIKTQLITSIKNIVAIDNKTLIALINQTQKIQKIKDKISLQDSISYIGENNTKDTIETINTLKIVKVDIKTGNQTELLEKQEIGPVEKIKLNTDNSSIIFLSKAKNYLLQLK